MKVNIAKSAGFCFGVKRALSIAFQTAQSASPVYMIGDIVHNEDVIKKLKRRGVKKVRYLKKGGKKILLVRAHGISQGILKKARQLGYTIVDATCPMVKEIHRIVKESERKNRKIIIIGDKKHDEVQGIIGQLKTKPIVVDNIENIPLATVRGIKNACVVAQSTQNGDMVLEIVGILRRYIKKLFFFNTICRPTQIKQEEIKKMPLENDVMIIIGSKTSANTKRLYEISKFINSRSYWVNSKKEIKPIWLKEAKRIGVTAGASTPEYIIEDIIKYLKQAGRN